MAKIFALLIFTLAQWTLIGSEYCLWGCNLPHFDPRLTEIGLLFEDCLLHTNFTGVCKKYDCYEWGICSTCWTNFIQTPTRQVLYGISYKDGWGGSTFGYHSQLIPFAKADYKYHLFGRNYCIKEKEVKCRGYRGEKHDVFRGYRDFCETCRRCVSCTFLDGQDEIETTDYSKMMHLFQTLERDIIDAYFPKTIELKTEIYDNSMLLEESKEKLSAIQENEDVTASLLREIAKLQEKISQLSEELKDVQEKQNEKIKYVDAAIEKADKLYQDIYDHCAQQHGALHTKYHQGLRNFFNGSFEEALTDICALIQQAKEEGVAASLDFRMNYYKGAAESEMGRYHEAIDTLTTMLDQVRWDEGYLERAVAYFETGQFDLAFKDYLTIFSSSIKAHPVDNWTPYSLEYASGITVGTLEGIGAGALEFIPSTLSSATGLCNGLWALLKNPGKASHEIVSATYDCLEYIRTHSTPEIAQTLVPELKELVTDWDSIPEYKRGQLTGYILGKYGVDVFMCVGTTKLFKAYRDLKRANNILTLELAAANAENKALLIEEAGKRLQSKAGNIKRFDIKALFNDKNKTRHIFTEEHNLERLGSQQTAVMKVTNEVLKADKNGLIPKAGPFEIKVSIDGHNVIVRGAIVDQELKYGTIFIPD